MRSSPNKARPLYDVIERELREKIDQGVWEPGHKLPSSRELCEQFKVSTITANRALDNLSKQGIIARHPGRGNFVRVTPSSIHPHTSPRMVAVVAAARGKWNPFFDGYYSVIAESAVSAARAVECELRMAYLPESAERKRSSHRKWFGGDVEGLIFLAVSSWAHEAERVALRIGKPTVFLDSYVEGWPCVVCDHVGASFRIARELLKAGHSRIGYLGNHAYGANLWNEADRASAFPTVAGELGLQINGRVHSEFDANEPSAAVLRRWVQEDGVTAIVISTRNQLYAIRKLFGSENAAELKGLSIFALESWFMQGVEPIQKLTGTVSDRQRMGREAFAWLSELVRVGAGPRERGGKRIVPMQWQEG